MAVDEHQHLLDHLSRDHDAQPRLPVSIEGLRALHEFKHAAEEAAQTLEVSGSQCACETCPSVGGSPCVRRPMPGDTLCSICRKFESLRQKRRLADPEVQRKNPEGSQ